VETGDGAMTPSVSLVPISYNGCAPLRPLVVNDTVLYLQAQRAAVRELAFDSRAVKFGWGSNDLSIMASHLLSGSGHTIVDWAFQRLPIPVVWAVRDDGTLLSITYSREMGVVAWARHDTDGIVDQVVCLPEGTEDALYVIVNRGGNHYIERMTSRHVTDRAEGCFLDSALIYNGIPKQTFNGRTVVAVRDGIVERPTTPVTGGSLTLSAPGSRVRIGLPYSCDLELLDFYGSGTPDTEAHSREKRVSKVIWEVDGTAGLSAGETIDSLSPWVPEVGYLAPPSGVMTDQLAVPITGSWNRGGRAVLRQSDPLPVTVLGAVREMEVGA
jgi:hypothetical protein